MNSKDNIEMKEIKVSRKKTLKEFLGRHIVGFYLVVILAILLFGNIAKAESADDFLDNFATTNGFTGSQYESYFVQARSECPYWVVCSVGNLQCIYFCSQPFTEDCFIWNSGYVFLYGGYLSATTYHTLTEDTICYSFCFNNNDVSNYALCIYRRFYSSGTTAQGNLNNNPFKPRYTPTTNDQIAGSASGQLSTYSTYTNASYYSYVNFTYNSYGVFPATNELVSYVDDERLKLYKLWSSQVGDSLVIDLSDFRTYTAAAAYNFSNINVTLSTNGVETVYTLPLANSSVSDGWNNQSNLYTVSTPLSDFTLSDAYDTYVTKVSFDMVTSSPGGILTQSFYVSTNFPLDLHHSAVTPEAIPTPATIYEDPAKPIDISDRKYDYFQQLQSSVSGGDIDFVSSYPVLPTWANIYELNTFFDVDNGVDDLHIYLGSVILGKYRLDSKYDFDIKAFIYDNAHSQLYDVIVIRLDQTDWPAVVNANTLPETQDFYGYVVLYTDSYYLRLDAETQFNILEALQLDANQQLANWNWLVTKLDDFELKTTQILNPLYDEVTYVDDKLASILYAVNSIETYNDSSVLDVLGNIYDAITGIGGTDTSDIETKLDTLINHFIANDSQENGAYKQFVSWLRDVNGKPVQYVTTGYQFFTELFDYFPFTRDLDGSGGFANMFDMGKGFIDISTGHTTGIPENYQGLSYYFNSANDGTYNVQSMSGR